MKPSSTVKMTKRETTININPAHLLHDAYFELSRLPFHRRVRLKLDCDRTNKESVCHCGGEGIRFFDMMPLSNRTK